MSTQSVIRIGQVGFGVVGGYPPAHWKFLGRRGRGVGPSGERVSSCMLGHMPCAGQTPFPDQGVSWDALVRLMKSE